MSRVEEFQSGLLYFSFTFPFLFSLFLSLSSPLLLLFLISFSLAISQWFYDSLEEMKEDHPFFQAPDVSVLFPNISRDALFDQFRIIISFISPSSFSHLPFNSFLFLFLMKRNHKK